MSEKVLVFRVVPAQYGRSVLSSKRIMDFHIKKAQEEGKTWYSTDLTVKARSVTTVERILFFGDGVQLFADVEQIEIGKNANDKFVPDDSDRYSPELFAKEERRSWFMLSNFRPASDEEVTALTASDGISALDKIRNPGRINRFFCS